MKKIVLLMIGLFFLPVSVIAYQVNIDAPETLTVGKPLVVTGTTTFGIGTPIDVVLYYQLTTTTEVKRKIAYIQPDKTFKAVFDTTGLKTGTYKVEVPTSGMGGDAITMRVVQLVDRSDAIRISTAQTQPYSGRLYIAGTIAGGENSGVQIEVVGPDNDVIFGPRYVNTNNAGDFSVDVPITDTGDYEVSFTDSKGYIGAKTFTVQTSPAMTMEQPLTETTTAPTVHSAHSRSSQEKPAYFIVRTGSSPALLYTSTSVDWIIEYTDDTGRNPAIVNKQGKNEAERLELSPSNRVVYIKVYPSDPAASGEVFLYGQNVDSITLSPSTPIAFIPTTTTELPETPETPLTPLACVVSCILAIFLFRKI